MIDVFFPETPCPACGTTNRRVRCPDDDTTLEPGDLIICDTCREIVEIVADGLRATGKKLPPLEALRLRMLA